MKANEEGKVYDDINITPMLDVAYVLLLIFIIMTTATVQGITVNLPKASSTPALSKPKTKAISITKDGTVYLDTYPISCLLYTSPSPRDRQKSRMPSSA